MDKQGSIRPFLASRHVARPYGVNRKILKFLLETISKNNRYRSRRSCGYIKEYIIINKKCNEKLYTVLDT